MLTLEAFKELEGRVVAGRAWFLTHGGFNNPKNQEIIHRWNKLAAHWLKEASLHKAIQPTLTTYSPSWHEVKFQKAYDKWKHTYPKAKRGTDPSTLPRESFT